MQEILGEALRNLIQTIIAVTFPILITYLSRYLASMTKSEVAERCIMEVGDAVTTAVLFVNQTYVDEMKKANAFNAANQRFALSLATDKAKDLLSDEAAQFLVATHGSIASYLAPKIEAEVKQQQK